MAWFRWSRVLGIVLLGVAVAAVLLVRASDEPRPWSTEQAADEYVAMAAPMTADLDALAALGSDATIEDWVAVCRRLTTSTAAYIEALDGGAWDPALRPFVDGAIATARSIRGWFVECTTATSMEALDDLGPISARIEDENATANLREQLGLSPT